MKINKTMIIKFLVWTNQNVVIAHSMFHLIQVAEANFVQ